MITYHTARINGEITSFKMEEGISMTGWNVEALSEDGLARGYFIKEASENKAFGIVRRKFRAEHKKRQTLVKSDIAFKKIQELPLEDRKDVLFYVYGLMQDRMTESDIKLIEKHVEETEQEIIKRDKKTMKRANEEFENSSYFDALKANFPEDVAEYEKAKGKK